MSRTRGRATLLASVVVMSVCAFSTATRAWTPTTPEVAVATFGGANADSGNSTAIDNAGNVYTAGNFMATVDFDPGASNSDLTAVGGQDAFVSKLDSAGNLLWAKQIGGATTDSASSVAIDSSGNVYVAGYFQGAVDFDPGAGVLSLTSNGSQDPFVMKLDSAGNLVWAQQLPDANSGGSKWVTVDSLGNVYVAGYFQGAADFDPGAGTATMTAVSSQDGFIWKLNTAGNYVWAQQTSGSSGDAVYSVAVDASGNVYSTGYFWGTLDFDPGVGTASYTAVGVQDTFVWKLNSAGNYVWVAVLSGSSSDLGLSVAVDASGNVYTAGTYQATIDFDPGVGTVSATSVGGQDGFVLKLNSSGAYVWVYATGSVSGEAFNSVVVDSSGNAFIAGSFQSTVDFDTGVGTTSFTSAGAQDVFVLKLNSSGNLVWVNQLGSTSADIGYSIAVNSSNISSVTGNFQGTVDFDPTSAVANLTSAGGTDGFIWKLDMVGYPFTPTTTSTTTTTVAPSTTIAPATTTTVAVTTTSVAVSAMSASSATSTTTVAPTTTVSIPTSGMPQTGMSIQVMLLWTLAILGLGVLLQLQVRRRQSQ